MKKHFLTVMIFCSLIGSTLGAGFFSLGRQANFCTKAFAETESVKAPADLSELQSAGDAQLARWAETLESFDGRDYGYITPARDQYQKKTCWAFAAVGAAEANILRKGIDKTASKDNLDLDETIAAYTRHTRDGSEDPLLLTADDTYDYGTWNQGDGGAASAFSIMTQGYTLVNENHFHNSVDEDTIRSKLGRSKYYVNSYQNISNDSASIKRAVLQYGAVAFNYASPNVGATKFFKKNKTTDHTSIIVGWDDTVDRAEFSPEKPDGDGAWIVKNSWGSRGDNGFYYISYEQPIGTLYSVDLSMRENYQNIYYYDGNVTASMTKHAGEAQAAIFEAKLSSPSKREQLKAVMISVPQGNLNVNIRIYQNLKANPGNVNDPRNEPEQGAPAAELNAHVDRIGMHTLDLEKAVDLEQGEYFSVVVRCTTESGTPVPVNCAVDERSVNDMTYYLQDGKWVNFKNSALYADSGTDKRAAKIRAITNTVERKPAADNDLRYARAEIANRLVYYEKGKELTPEAQVSLDGILLERGQDYTLKTQEIVSPGMTKIEITGTGSYKGVRTTYFEVAKATVPPGAMSGTVEVGGDVVNLYDIPIPPDWKWVGENMPLELGMYPVSLIYIGEDKQFYQTVTCDFYVNKYERTPQEDLDISTAEIEIVGSYVYTGEPIVPNVKVRFGSAELQEGVDCNLTFQNNVNAGIAAVTAEGIGRYCGRTSRTFVIGKAERPSADTTVRYDGKATKLSDIPLPSGFVWVDGNTEIAGSRMTANAVYTGQDADNYEVTILTFEIVLENQEQEPEKEPEKEPEQKPDKGPDEQPDKQPEPQEPPKGPDKEPGQDKEQEPPKDSKDGDLIWLAVAVPIAVLAVAGIWFAVARHKRR